jgi:hypothetical protein
MQKPRPAIDAASYWTWCTLALVAALLLFVAATFDQHGISNDEPVQHIYGRLLLDYYRSGLQDQRAFHYINLYLYGGLFDIIAAGLEPLTAMSIWDLRHLLTAFIGISAIVAVALLGRRLATPRAGFLAAMLLTLTGAWSGAMFTHTKDIPFGAAMIWSVYFTTLLLGQLPRIGWGTVLGAGLSIGAALGLRVGGLFAYLYLGASVLGVLLLQSSSPRDCIRRLLASSPRLLVVIGVALLVTALSWPWAFMGWRNLFDAATKFSHFSFDMLTLLDGQLIKIGEVPATYLSRYLLIRLPELLLLGLLLSVCGAAVALLRRRVQPETLIRLLPLLLAACFPIFYSLATAPALYNGVRHFSFVLPPLALVSALGLEYMLSALRPWRSLLGLAAAVLLLVGGDNLLSLLRLHPYEYVAYNHLVGGTAGAYERYEGDYWNDSLREATLLLNHLLKDELGNTSAGFTVAVCAEPVQATVYLDPRFRVVRDWPSADFFISAVQTRCDRAMAGTIIGDVSRDGVPLIVIKDRRELVGHERRVLGEMPP